MEREKEGQRKREKQRKTKERKKQRERNHPLFTVGTKIDLKEVSPRDVNNG